MESNKEINKFLETKLKLLEIENQKLQANIEANNREIEQIKMNSYIMKKAASPLFIKNC